MRLHLIVSTYFSCCLLKRSRNKQNNHQPRPLKGPKSEPNEEGEEGIHLPTEQEARFGPFVVPISIRVPPSLSSRVGIVKWAHGTTRPEVRSKRGRRGRPCWCGCLLLPFPSPARAGQGGATHNSLTSPSHPESPHRPHVGSPRSDAGEQGVEDRVRSSPTPSPFLRTSATGEGDKHVSGHQLLVLRLPAP